MLRDFKNREITRCNNLNYTQFSGLSQGWDEDMKRREEPLACLAGCAGESAPGGGGAMEKEFRGRLAKEAAMRSACPSVPRKARW